MARNVSQTQDFGQVQLQTRPIVTSTAKPARSSRRRDRMDSRDQTSNPRWHGLLKITHLPMFENSHSTVRGIQVVIVIDQDVRQPCDGSLQISERSRKPRPQLLGSAQKETASSLFERKRSKYHVADHTSV